MKTFIVTRTSIIVKEEEFEIVAESQNEAENLVGQYDDPNEGLPESVSTYFEEWEVVKTMIQTKEIV